MAGSLSDPFATGGRLRLAQGDDGDGGPFLLRGANREVGSLDVDASVAVARLVVGTRGWDIEPYERGWRLAATDDDGVTAAWWHDRGRLRAGRVVLASDHDFALRHAFAHRPARLVSEGRVLLRAEVLGHGPASQAIVDVCGSPPEGADAELLVAFTAAALLLHRMFAPPRRLEHPWTEGGWFGGGGLFGGGDGGGGGGGGDSGGGGGGS